MKKTITLLTGFLLLAIALHAQKKQSRFFTELALGPSFPVGRFASTEYINNHDQPGFAKTGLGAQLSVGYYLNRSIGVMLLAGYSENPQDEKVLKDHLEKNSYSGLQVTSLDAKNWKTVKLMAGGFVAIPLTAKKDLVLIPKLTAGVSKYDVPGLTWTGVNRYGGFQGVGTKKTSLDWSFCYQGSVGLRYNISSNLHVLLDISSFNTTANHNYSYTILPGPRTRYVENKYKQSTVNAMAGIGLTF